MDDWRDLLGNIPYAEWKCCSDTTREDVEEIGLIIKMAERDYENHQKKEKKDK
jgi:hypothetical protein